MGECAGAFYWPLVRVPRARMGARVPPNCQQKRDQGVNPGESDQQGGQKALRSKALSCAQPQRLAGQVLGVGRCSQAWALSPQRWASAGFGPLTCAFHLATPEEREALLELGFTFGSALEGGERTPTIRRATRQGTEGQQPRANGLTSLGSK